MRAFIIWALCTIAVQCNERPIRDVSEIESNGYDYPKPQARPLLPEPQIIPQPQPQYIQPRPQYIQPRPQYIQPAPQPQYIQPAPQPQYIQPAPQPQYIQPAPQPQYIQPRPQYVQPLPQPQYVQPAPQPQYIQPAPRPQYIQPQPQYIQPSPQPQYIPPTPQVVYGRPQQLVVTTEQPLLLPEVSEAPHVAIDIRKPVQTAEVEVTGSTSTSGQSQQLFWPLIHKFTGYYPQGSNQYPGSNSIGYPNGNYPQKPLFGGFFPNHNGRLESQSSSVSSGSVSNSGYDYPKPPVQELPFEQPNAQFSNVIDN